MQLPPPAPPPPPLLPPQLSSADLYPQAPCSRRSICIRRLQAAVGRPVSAGFHAGGYSLAQSPYHPGMDHRTAALSAPYWPSGAACQVDIHEKVSLWEKNRARGVGNQLCCANLAKKQDHECCMITNFSACAPRAKRARIKLATMTMHQ